MAIRGGSGEGAHDRDTEGSPNGRPQCYGRGRGVRVGSVGFSGRGGRRILGIDPSTRRPPRPSVQRTLEASLRALPSRVSTAPQPLPRPLGVWPTMHPPRKSHTTPGNESERVSRHGGLKCLSMRGKTLQTTIARYGGGEARERTGSSDDTRRCQSCSRPSPPPPASPRSCPDDTNEVLRRVATAPGGYP